MLISGIASAASLAFSAIKSLAASRQDAPTETANYADKVSISAAGRALMERSTQSTEEAAIQSRLDVIKSKPAVERTREENDFVREQDKRFKELSVRDSNTWNADEVGYMQKAGGFVNFMAFLSPKEKALYDEMVANGDTEAAHGLSKVAWARILAPEGQQLNLAKGGSLDPWADLAAANVRNLKQIFVDDPQSDQQLDALAAYLQKRGNASAAAKV